MPRHLLRLLAAVAALLFVAAACTSSDDDDAAADDDEQTDVQDESTDDTADDSSDDTSDDDSGDQDREDAIELIETIGFSGGAECIVDSLADQGIDIGELDLSSLNTTEGEVAEAMANAGAECAGEVEFEGNADLNNEAFFDAFVQGFAQTSGLSVETAECVAEYLRDNDIDPTGPEVASAAQDALADCQ